MPDEFDHLLSMTRPRRSPSRHQRAQNRPGAAPGTQIILSQDHPASTIFVRAPSWGPGRLDKDERALILQFCTDALLDDVVAMQRVARLRLADELSQVTDQEHYVRMFGALAAGMRRMIGLLRAKHALAGEAADVLLAAIGQALDELKAEMGVDL